MKEEGPNIGARVRVKLLRLAKERGDDFQLVLLRYVHERLLSRLAASKHGSHFVLKGAALFTVWTGHPHRATRDLDLLGSGAPDEQRLEKISEVVHTAVEDDGVRFDASSVHAERIREGEDYEGIRLRLAARVATAVLRVQVDVGFGDAVTPAPEEIAFPVLLDGTAPRLRAYPRETHVAEKLEALVKLGLANSRMKDLYDLAELASLFSFEGQVLSAAIRATFERRGTPLPADRPVAFTPAFFDAPEKRRQWSGFVRKAGIQHASTLAAVVGRVERFAAEPLDAARGTSTFRASWPVGGPWSTAPQHGRAR